MIVLRRKIQFTASMKKIAESLPQPLRYGFYIYMYVQHVELEVLLSVVVLHENQPAGRMFEYAVYDSRSEQHQLNPGDDMNP